MYIDIPNLINLSVVPGLGPTRIRSLIAKFRTAEHVFSANKVDLCAVEGIDSKVAQNIKNYTDYEYGNKQLKRLSATGGRLMTFWDDEYPSILKNIYDPPVMLFMIGAFEQQDEYALGVVGTRIPTSYGKLVTEKIGKELVHLGITIVSGLARGVDTIAHSTAVKASGRTVAVIGSGIDVIYPPENRYLAEKIAENGALVSEFPMGAAPDAVNFPKRNRIIAGLTLGTLVIEAGEKSGALITANNALNYNREVFAIPGNITSNKSIGSNELIKAGAKLVSGVEDILSELSNKINIYLKENISIKKKGIDLDGIEKVIFDNLSDIPVHIDALSRKLKKPTNEILAGLLNLEFGEIVKQLPGKLFVRA